jgi:hypothetical protein
MFAPLIARAKTKAIAASTNGLQHRLSQPDLRSTEKVVGGENEGGAGTKNMTARETTRDLSSNFSKIPYIRLTGLTEPMRCYRSVLSAHRLPYSASSCSGGSMIRSNMRRTTSLIR